MENKSYRTARGRKEISAPLRDHLISDWDWDRVGTILDFGCGKGTDAEFLEAEGFKVDKYDPHFFPEKPEDKQFDVVLCNYVLCVVEEHEQQAVIDDAMSYVKPDGWGYFVVRRDKKNLNGWTSRQTFQRLVELSEDDGFELWAEEKGRYAIYRKKQREGMIATDVKFTLKISDEENDTGHEFKEGMGAGVLYTVIGTFHQTPEEYESEYGRRYLAMGVRQFADELKNKMITVEVEEIKETE
jgi:SAM-dependent methyltransferase